MWLIFIVLLVIFFSGLSTIFALSTMYNNRKLSSQLPEQYTRAEVKRVSTNGIISFRTDQNEIIDLHTTQRVSNSLLKGFYGDLVYQGNRLISFVRLPDHEERKLETSLEEGYFFEYKTNRINPMEFYCDAPSLGINIPASDTLKLDVEEVLKYINSISEQTYQNFFGLDNTKQVIQFFNDGNTNDFLIDIPALDKGGSYQAIIKGTNTVKTIVKAFYNNENVMTLADFDLIEF